MSFWKILRGGIPTTEWEKRSLLRYFAGLLIRSLAFLIALFASFAAAKVLGVLGDWERISWAELARTVWTLGPLAMIPFVGFCMAEEALTRRRHGGGKPPAR